MSENNASAVTKEVTYNNADALVVEKVLDAFIVRGGKGVKSVKGPYRLSNNLKVLSGALETYKTKLQELGESHILTEEYTDEAGNTATRKVRATEDVKQEDGTWKTVEQTDPNTGAPIYKIADPEAYVKALRDLGEETVTVTLSRIPVSMLDGATEAGQLFYHCSDFIYED